VACTVAAGPSTSLAEGGTVLGAEQANFNIMIYRIRQLRRLSPKQQ
jgi:hypothetical protein